MSAARGRRAWRAGSIRPEQAALLREVQQLAAEGARLRDAMYEASSDLTEMARILHDANAVDRRRILAEVTARSAGVPAAWVDHVREHGQLGHPWDDQQLLPTPPPDRRRRSERRVADDTRQLTDMAAISVVRDHLHVAAGITTEPEPVAAEQFGRNMAALTARSLRVARAVGLTDSERVALWERTDRDWSHEIAPYLHHYGRGDIDSLWRAHADPAIAAGVSKAMTRWAKTNSKYPRPAEPSHEHLPPPPTYLISQARHALDTLLATGHHHDASISTAVDVALPPAARDWQPDPAAAPDPAPGRDTDPGRDP
ncbi:hypothetical protein BJY24_005768 [Nocardia transvalensis]|uniref:Uncharacterized protein n=1 Tax=Nocardia transvalensis TaxID=37333 RepID=A0A7W9PIM8_9NOCA|nr:hypothetical protein [Nocardia transvalensis]MBB5916856.1 hypothetical protein [Nocardia transvalensis]